MHNYRLHDDDRLMEMVRKSNIKMRYLTRYVVIDYEAWLLLGESFARWKRMMIQLYLIYWVPVEWQKKPESAIGPVCNSSD